MRYPQPCECARMQATLGLLKEDDWSFIIKTHALVEAAVIRAIENQLCGHSITKFALRYNWATFTRVTSSSGLGY